MSASEASTPPTMNLHLQGIETETYHILSKISEYTNSIDVILKKYDVKGPDDIEKMIGHCKIEAHPAYEDYLSVISYQQNIMNLKELLIDLVKRI